MTGLQITRLYFSSQNNITLSLITNLLYKFIIQKLTCLTKLHPAWLQKSITCCLDSALTAYSFAEIISAIFAKVNAAKIKDISSERIVNTFQKQLWQSNATSLKTNSLKEFPKVPPLKQIHGIYGDNHWSEHTAYRSKRTKNLIFLVILYKDSGIFSKEVKVAYFFF